jgi:hypothetical protein
MAELIRVFWWERKGVFKSRGQFSTAIFSDFARLQILTFLVPTLGRFCLSAGKIAG